jgi:hypothetical protein
MSSPSRPEVRGARAKKKVIVKFHHFGIHRRIKINIGCVLGVAGAHFCFRLSRSKTAVTTKKERYPGGNALVIVLLSTR